MFDALIFSYSQVGWVVSPSKEGTSGGFEEVSLGMKLGLGVLVVDATDRLHLVTRADPVDKLLLFKLVSTGVEACCPLEGKTGSLCFVLLAKPLERSFSFFTVNTVLSKCFSGSMPIDVNVFSINCL